MYIPYSIESVLDVIELTTAVLLMLKVVRRANYEFCDIASNSDSNLFLSFYRFRFWFQTLQEAFQPDLTDISDQVGSSGTFESFLFEKKKKNCVYLVGLLLFVAGWRRALKAVVLPDCFQL